MGMRAGVLKVFDCVQINPRVKRWKIHKETYHV